MHREKNLFLILSGFIGFSSSFLFVQLFILSSLPHVPAIHISPYESSLSAQSLRNTHDTPGIEEAPEILPSQPDKPSIPTIVDKKPLTNNCQKPDKTYEDYSLLNLGQEVALPDPTYVPSQLIVLAKNITKYPNTCLEEEASDELMTMIADAKKEKLDIRVSSAFRSYDTQKFLLERNIKSGNKDATRRIAKPGHSEHQLGLAVDLTSSSINNSSSTTTFSSTKEYEWLKKNSSKYGFIESYPEGKEKITGYMYESWHYRYVGPENAAAITTSKQTVNEYLKDQIDQKEKENAL